MKAIRTCDGFHFRRVVRYFLAKKTIDEVTMQRTTDVILAAVGLAAALLLANAGDALAQSATKCSSRYQLAWEMPLRSSDVGRSPGEVLERPEFHTANVHSLHGISIGRAPDGTVGLQVNVKKGKSSTNKSNTFFLSQLGNPGADAACLSLRIFLENGFEWPDKGGGKMGWGLWGGEKSNTVGGGAPPATQTGWSVRNVNSKYGFRFYSYHLNRSGNGQYGEYGRHWSPRFGSSDWRAGSWTDIEVEIVMNDPGRANGYSQLWVNGKRVDTMSNLQFRRDAGWAIRGLMFNDMWQAPSPKDQKMWYADYKLYTSGKSTSGQQSSGRTASTSSGDKASTSSGGKTSSNTSAVSSGAGFGAVEPNGTISGRNVVLTWNRDARAERYYVKLLTDRPKWSDRSIIYNGTVWPAKSCSGSTCRLSIGNLKADKYEWMVRPRSGSTIGSYSTMAFRVR